MKIQLKKKVVKFDEFCILWYYIIGAVIAAFIVYLVATGGWEKVSEMWNRTKYKSPGGE